MSLLPTCVVCDAILRSPGPCCGGVTCKRFEATEDDRLTESRGDPLHPARLLVAGRQRARNNETAADWLIRVAPLAKRLNEESRNDPKDAA